MKTLQSGPLLSQPKSQSESGEHALQERRQGAAHMGLRNNAGWGGLNLSARAAITPALCAESPTSTSDAASLPLHFGGGWESREESMHGLPSTGRQQAGCSPLHTQGNCGWRRLGAVSLGTETVLTDPAPRSTGLEVGSLLYLPPNQRPASPLTA